jgi:hypothetical protein
VKAMNELVFGDMSEQFDFDEEGMDYVDGPLSGWLRRKTDGAWFAYECQPVIAGKLWHWTLVLVSGKGEDPRWVLQEASEAKSGTWQSITEDRRASQISLCRLVELDNRDAIPVLGVGEAGTK